MAVFLMTFLLMVLIVLGMSLGVLVGRGPIKGSCGGMSALGLDTECDICGGDPNKCDNQEESAQSTKRPEVYDAMKAGSGERRYKTRA